MTVKEKQTSALLNAEVLKSVIGAALDAAAKNTNNSLQKKDVPSIETKVAKEVNAVVQNATNQEPWYKSRVVVGTAVAMIGLIGRFAGVQIDAVDQGTLTDLILQGATLLGSLYAMYGRLKAGLKPLGE